MGNELSVFCGITVVLADGNRKNTDAFVEPRHELSVYGFKQVTGKTLRATVRHGHDLSGVPTKTLFKMEKVWIRRVQDESMVEAFFEPLAQPFEVAEVNNEAALVGRSHKFEFKGPVVPVNQTAVPCVIRLAVSERHVVITLGTGNEL